MFGQDDDLYKDPTGVGEGDDPEEEEFEENDDGVEGAAGGTEEEEQYLTQDDFDRVLKRKHAQWERKFARRLGFKSVEEALPYLQAGRVVSEAANMNPSEVVTRVSGGAQYNQPGAPQAVGPGSTQLEQRLDRIEGLLEEDRGAQLLKSQEAEARKEFGVLYEKHRDEIEDKADELGLSLLDAAAIVLRTQLQGHFKAQVSARKQAQRRKKVDSSDGAAASKDDVNIVLTPAQKRVAKRMNISYKDYYQQLKELGRV